MTDGSAEEFCNSCGRSTMHVVLAEGSQTGSPLDLTGCSKTYKLLKCRGCDMVMLTIVDGEEIDYFPPREIRRAPWWARTELSLEDLEFNEGVPSPIRQLMIEVYLAVNNGSLRLAGMGIRAALEATMVAKVGEGKNFESTVDAFAAANYLSVRQRGLVDTLLLAGHAAVHRLWNPSRADVYDLLWLIESVIENTFLHDELAERLKKKIPVRPPRDARKSR